MTMLRVLIIDDSPDDADLLRRELRRRGYDFESERIQTGVELEAALQAQEWDVVLSDWNMPRFSAPAALEIVKEHNLDIPFIIVSGVIGDELVIEAMKGGARDFFSKDRLTLLAPAIDRELREAGHRRERREMQEQLTISERMASVGMLAAGVAHEINNPLAVVVGNLDLALRDLAELERSHAELAGLTQIVVEVCEAHEAAARIRNVAKDLKLFARSDNEYGDAVDVQGVIESSLRMAQNEIRHRARLRTDFSDVPPVAGNESRLGQVFLNLIVNAAQSIPEGNVDGNEISITTAMIADGRVAVTIRDTGSGMTLEVKKNIFTPFFTTKPVSEGTGLGLAICHRIVTEMGGTIVVESEHGVGSAFVVHLEPATAPHPPLEVAPSTNRADVPRGSILIIDDEASIGLLVQKVLSEHDVTRTTSGAEAIDWISQGSRFDIIFCDVMMPDVTGMDVHLALARIAADQAAAMVFLSGGTFTAQARQFLDDADNLRVDKPFDNEELRTIVDARLAVSTQ